MKVFHTIPAYYPSFYYGGPTYSVDALCRHLARLGCEVRVVATNSNGPAATVNVDTEHEVMREENLYVRYLRRGRIEGFAWKMIPEMRRYIRWADVVHITAIYSPSSMATLLLANLAGKPVVVSPRGSLQRWDGNRGSRLKAVWERVYRMLAPRRTVLHVTSEEEARDSGSRMGGMRAVVIPNGVEIPEAIPQRTRGYECRVLYIGRLHPIKGLENLIEAFARLESRVPHPFSLTIAGTGEEKYVRKLHDRVTELSLDTKIRFLGEVTGDAKERTFAEADVVIQPSFTENFGMSAAEALARGIPVIASKGTPWKRLDEMGAGLWVENDPDSLAKALERISGMDLIVMGSRGRVWMQRECSWPAVARQMAGLYESLPAQPQLRLAESSQ